MMTFTEVTGKERYTITDKITGGVNWAESKKEMLLYVYYVGARLGHDLVVYDKTQNAYTHYTPRPQSEVA